MCRRQAAVAAAKPGERRALFSPGDQEDHVPAALEHRKVSVTRASDLAPTTAAFVHLVVTTMVRSESGLRTRSCTAWRVGIPPPQGPSLGSGL